MPDSSVSRLISLFFMTNRSLHKHLQQAKVVSTFSFLQFLTMKIVGEEGPISMKDVAHLLSITPASTTSLVNGLVDLGVLERVRDRRDRRVIRLRATAYGKKRLNETDEKAKKELTKIFLQLSATDRSQMIDVLKKLSGILVSKKTRMLAALREHS